MLTIGERRGAMVIEAKRVGVLAPATKSHELMQVALSGPVVKPPMPGIRQAMTCATEKGIAVAAVTTAMLLQGKFGFLDPKRH
jgi:hypothetical protein